MRVSRKFLVVSLIYAAIFFTLYSLYAFILSDSGVGIALVLVGLPLLVMVSVVHIFAVIVGRTSLLRSFRFALCFGLFCSLTLLVIQTSRDAVAVMGIMGMCYAAFFVIGFIASCVVLSVVKLVRGRISKEQDDDGIIQR